MNHFIYIPSKFNALLLKLYIFSHSGLGYSAILGNDDNYLRTLSNWLQPVTQSKSSYWNRCYRATVNGWASATFHSNCDSKGPSVTIIRVGQYIFGGYTSLSWSKYYDLLYIFLGNEKMGKEIKEQHMSVVLKIDVCNGKKTVSRKKAENISP